MKSKILDSSHRKNFFIRSIFWLDKWTDLLGIIERKRAVWILNNFPIDKWMINSSKVLDIGSGIGDIPTLLHRRTSNEVFGIDLVDYRRKEIKYLNKFYFIIANCYNLPFLNNQFENVLFLVTLHHLWEPHKAIKEAMRVLKHNGRLIILEDIIGHPKSWLTLLTKFIDGLINLNFVGNPNTQKSQNDWLITIETLKLNIIHSYTISWGPFFKSLKLGIFILEKG